MAKFIVSLERKCVIDEVASITVDATTAAEARAIVKQIINQADDGLDWEACDTNYASTRIDEVTKA